MFLYNVARKVNHQLKKYKKLRAGRHLSPVRRIEFVSPPREGRFVAMTFDDGPTTMPTTSNPRIGLTESLLDTLKKYDAKGTFDIIGTTKENYPDKPGKIGNFTWSGLCYDHYPQYENDEEAGAVNQPELVKRILAEGHEITSHTYSHRLFGPMKAVYGNRIYLNTLEEVVSDLKALHTYMEDNFGYTMTLSRPPHYIDAIPDGKSAYDAYRIMGYNYLAASFDGAGWQPLDTYEKEVAAMIDPLEKALQENPDALNGQIIFQKDGCNMNLRTPVCDALDAQLAILTRYGYKVITVSELLSKSPFEDVANDHPKMPYIKELLKKGRVIGYKNNTFKPEKVLTKEEFYIMSADPRIFKDEKDMDYRKMVQIAKDYAKDHDLCLQNTSGKELLALAQRKGIAIDEKGLKDKKRVKRIDGMQLIAALSQ